MQFNTIAALLASLSVARSANAIDIISSNDDGWAEANIRALFDTLTAGGHSVVVAAPAENQSGTGNATWKEPPYCPLLIIRFSRVLASDSYNSY
jgi:hypothetical protein